MNYTYIVMMFIAMTGQCYAMVKDAPIKRDGCPCGRLRNSQENRIVDYKDKDYNTKQTHKFDEDFLGPYLTALARQSVSTNEQTDHEHRNTEEA